ncbi:hypothetical protein [Rhodanobacter sp. PCA2]|uniref:hypothetical protein n=1 Tax=Rhodanobacter sp. PCA2 TaxID=2006117 RepID=UPI0015E6D391|nr:hypothetical protein [Rhodanobacter sp. PCA2]
MDRRIGPVAARYRNFVPAVAPCDAWDAWEIRFHEIEIIEGNCQYSINVNCVTRQSEFVSNYAPPFPVADMACP